MEELDFRFKQTVQRKSYLHELRINAEEIKEFIMSFLPCIQVLPYRRGRCTFALIVFLLPLEIYDANLSFQKSPRRNGILEPIKLQGN